jgi:hypothetical protein
LGNDITHHDFKRARSFLDGGSQAAEMTNGILQRTADSEAGSHDRSYLRSIRYQLSFWCFAGLWPWLWHKNHEQAMFFLTRYMNIVHSLIAVSYGRPVTSITHADFAHTNNVDLSDMSPFIDTVAKPSIYFYHDTEVSEQLREECAFVNIPHIDPSQDRYGTTDIRLRRVLGISMQETFVLVDSTLRLSSSMHKTKRHCHASTSAQCNAD